MPTSDILASRAVARANANYSRRYMNADGEVEKMLTAFRRGDCPVCYASGTILAAEIVCGDYFVSADCAACAASGHQSQDAKACSTLVDEILYLAYPHTGSLRRQTRAALVSMVNQHITALAN